MVPGESPGTDPSALPDGRLDQLESLAAALERGGLQVNLLAPPGRLPSLRVLNPAAAAMVEDVYAAPCADGTWWFWWSWAERIAAGADVAGAAARIAHVLAAASGEHAATSPR